MITKNDAIEQTRRQFRLMFRTMAMSCAAWHLYATRDGVAIAQEGEHLVRLVANVHAATEQQVVNSLSHELDRGTPHLWADHELQTVCSPTEVAQLRSALSLCVKAIDNLLPGAKFIPADVGLVNEALMTARPLCKEV